MININSALEELHKQFSIKGCFFLSKISDGNGERDLYQWLTSVYQSSYSPTERIVVVQDCVDSYPYKDMPGYALTCLQKYASQIDISNFFITVVTANKDIPKDLEQLRSLYSTDDCPMQYVLVDDEYVKLQSKKTDTFCVLPWIHLYIGTDGNVLPCCQSNHQSSMGNIEDNDIKEIINSNQFVELRSNMLNGVRSKQCENCYKKEDDGIKSSRLKSNEKWPIDRSSLNANGTIADFSPKYLDIRLSNTCNLKCRMCDAYFSSAIAQEQKEIFKKSIIEILDSQQRQRALASIFDFLPAVEKIYFAGGEPLLVTEHYKILEELVKIKHTDLDICYNTNFTKFQYKNINVLDLWRKFTNITVGASLDACGEVAEYIRHGTIWSDIESNLDLLKKSCPHVKFTVTSTVGLMNVESLIFLQKDWHCRKKLNIDQFSLNAMVSPDHLTVRVLPLHHKQRLGDLITEHIKWCKRLGANTLAMQWQGVLTYMLERDDSHYLSKFRQLTGVLDFHRRESFKKVFPKFQDIL